MIIIIIIIIIIIMIISFILLNHQSLSLMSLSTVHKVYEFSLSLLLYFLCDAARKIKGTLNCRREIIYFW